MKVEAKYRFKRDSSAMGFIRSERGSTDALNALHKWKSQGKDRSYDILVDTNDELVANVVGDDSDFNDPPTLDDFCNQFGIRRTLVK